MDAIAAERHVAVLIHLKLKLNSQPEFFFIAGTFPAQSLFEVFRNRYAFVTLRYAGKTRMTRILPALGHLVLPESQYILDSTELHIGRDESVDVWYKSTK